MFFKKKKDFDKLSKNDYYSPVKKKKTKKKKEHIRNIKQINYFISLIKKYKIASSLIIVILLSIITFHFYNTAILDATKLVEIPVANKYLKSNHKIEESDIKFIKIPSYIVLSNVETDYQNILGKYVDTFDSLANDSLFYKDLIVNEAEIDNAYLFNLKPDEVAISIDSDIKSSYSNSILVNQLIDLYYLGEAESENFDNKKQLVYGEIVKNARVIAVKDKDGENIDGDGENNTAIVVVALSQEDAHIVELAKASGSVSLVISYDNINLDNTNTYYNLDKMTSIILNKSIDVELVKNE